jgi:hypothetical protein
MRPCDQKSIIARMTTTTTAATIQAQVGTPATPLARVLVDALPVDALPVDV